MSKQILFIVGCLLLSLSLQAQDDVPILLTKTYKKVKYAPEQGARYSKVEATKSLGPEGVLKLSGKATARLYCNGTFKELEGKGMHPVASLFEDELRYAPMGFSSTFNSRLMAAIGGPKGSDTTSISSGWGNKKFEIISSTPIGKAVAGQLITFRWQSKKDLPEYTFSLEDESGKVVHSAAVKKKEYMLNLGELGLKEGKKYAWKVVETGGAAFSNKYFFSIARDAEKAEVMKLLQEEEVYQQADPLMKKLMEAVSFEDAEFYYAADKAYAEAAGMSDTGNLPQEMREALTRKQARAQD